MMTMLCFASCDFSLFWFLRSVMCPVKVPPLLLPVEVLLSSVG